MIEPGDGSWAERLGYGKCPNCRSALRKERETETRVYYHCGTCRLKIVDVKGEKDE